MKTVLIVSDDAHAAGRLAHLFAHVPCDVALAVDGPRARHLMEVLAFDLVFVDSTRAAEAAALVAELGHDASAARRARFVALTRSPVNVIVRLPRGFDGQVSLAMSDGELVRAAFGVPAALLSPATGG